PASQLSETQKVYLRDELRAFASLSLSPLPDYQVLSLSVDEAFRDKILVLVYDMTSQPAQLTGFASSIWLDIPGVPQRVLHIGLAVVAPGARYGGLTYEMNGRILLHTLMNVYPGGHWITNLSSAPNVLGKFGDFTAQPYPSPFCVTASWAVSIPSETHLQIARWIDANARARMHISPVSVFDERTFVFKDLNVGTAFTKDIDDDACQHRNEGRNVFYKRLLRKHHADGVLQVGWVDPQRCAKLVLSPDFRALRDVAHNLKAML
ncbi:hypothetical protein EXIGLDRAFT_610538, partial [Exidia glandulosa HHB12029]